VRVGSPDGSFVVEDCVTTRDEALVEGSTTGRRPTCALCEAHDSEPLA
jgi:hypothetical protein